jgi:hypothetical protein
MCTLLQPTRSFLIVFLLLLVASYLHGQTKRIGNTDRPVGQACALNDVWVYNMSNRNYFHCESNIWVSKTTAQGDAVFASGGVGVGASNLHFPVAGPTTTSGSLDITTLALNTPGLLNTLVPFCSTGTGFSGGEVTGDLTPFTCKITARTSSSVTVTWTGNQSNVNIVFNSNGGSGPAGTNGTNGTNSLVWKGTWSSSTTYAINDGVNENGSSYIAVAVNTNVDPSSDGGTHWAVFALKGTTGSIGLTGSTGTTGSQGLQGNTGTQGPIGNTGSQGVPGATGTTGTNGTNGTNGLGITWRAAWSSITPYAINDSVSFGGSSYIAVAINTNVTPGSDSSKWNLAAQKGDTGASGGGFTLSGTAHDQGILIYNLSDGSASSSTCIIATGSLTCPGTINAGDSSTTTQIAFFGHTSGNTVSVQPLDTTAAGSLTVPGVTGTLAVTSGTPTTGAYPKYDSVGRLVNGAPVNIRVLVFPFDGGGAEVPLNATRYLHVPFACTITAVSILADTGTLTVQFWKTASGTASPQNTDTISTSGISLSTGTALLTTTLTDFSTTAIATDDFLAASITSITGTTNSTISLVCAQ